MTDEIK